MNAGCSLVLMLLAPVLWRTINRIMACKSIKAAFLDAFDVFIDTVGTIGTLLFVQSVCHMN